LQQKFPQNVAVAQYYVPELEAAADIGINEPAAALQSLLSAGEYDQISLAHYLRGLAHAAVGQMPVAVVDFQAALNHRGVAYTLGSDVYPMAEIGMARAAWASHDKETSASAYIKFLSLWPNSDKNDPLVKEALARTKARAR
jgi:serine/threonine-protein kinase